MKLSPSVRGIGALSWTTTVFADRMAACIASTLVPREQKPCESGGVTFTNTTSSGCDRLEQARDVREEDRDVVGAALVDGPPRVRPDEQRAVPEMPRHLGREVRSRALGMEVHDRDVGELGRPVDERLEQHRRRGRGAVDIHAIPGPDDLRRLGRRDDLHRPSLRPGPSRRACHSDAQVGTFGPAGLPAGRAFTDGMETVEMTPAAFTVRPIEARDQAALSASTPASRDSREARFHGAVHGIGTAWRAPSATPTTSTAKGWSRSR